MTREKIISLEDAEVSVRTYNVLSRAGIRTLNDLCQYTEDQVKRIRNLGQKSMNEIIAKMNQHGFSFYEERTEERAETHTCDYGKKETHGDVISRADAVNAVAELVSSMSVCISVDECHGMKRMQGMAVRALNNLPSAQPEKACIANITLSEEQLREVVEKVKSGIIQVLPSTEPEEDWTEITVICDKCGHAVHAKREDCRVSAEPERKTGRWMEITEGDCSGYDPVLAGYNDPVVGYVCSCCRDGYAKEVMDEKLWNFCPNCGSYNGGEK